MVQETQPTRERILEAALDTFAEYGFDGTSTREVCRRAGANAALLNYHWGSKEKLWAAVCDVVVQRLLRATAGGAIDPALPLPDLLRRLIETIFDWLAADPRPARIGLWASMQAESMDFPSVFQSIEPVFRAAAAYLKRQKAAGAVGDIDVEMALVTFYGQFLQPFLDAPGHRALFGRDFTDPAHARRVKEALVQNAFAALGIRTKGRRP